MQVVGPGGSGTLSGVKAIAAGGHHSLALKTDGSVWAWGNGGTGELGNGQCSNSSNSPVQVVGPGGVGTLTDVVAISAGASHNLALKTDGTGWAWGNDGNGQLGDGAGSPTNCGSSNPSATSPVQVVGVSGVGTLGGVAAIAAGSLYSLVLKTDGSVWAWGAGSAGQLGNGGNTTSQSSPVQVVGPGGSGTLGGVAAIAAGGGHSLALGKQEQTISFAALANRPYGPPFAVRASASSGLPVSFTSTTPSVCTVDSDGDPVTLLALGTCTLVASQPGNFNYEAATPVSRSFQVAAGAVWAWGDDSYGELGDGTVANPDSSALPGRVIGPTTGTFLGTVVAIAAGGGHSLALKLDGTVWAWGDDSSGQLGDGTVGNPTTRHTPSQVVSLSNVIAIAAGGTHSLALKRDGTVWAWGYDGYGVLGDGTVANPDTSATPSQVVASGGGFLADVVAIAGGDYHSLALKADGTVWAWGDDEFGQLGDGTVAGPPLSATPSQVISLSDVTAIAGGAFHSLALKADGTVWAWGFDANGQLGDGTAQSPLNSATPSQVIAPGGGFLTDISAIAAGSRHSLALKANGTVWAWGSDGSGELGDGSVQDPPFSATPSQVVGPTGADHLTGVAAIAGGAFYSLALKADGTVYAWGEDGYGQLGDGTVGDGADGHGERAIPNRVEAPGGGFLTNVIAVAAGFSHGLALRPLPVPELTVNPVTTHYGGNETLIAILTDHGTGVGGQTITFSLRGIIVGTATTAANGLALLDVSLGSIPAGSYPTGVGASFAGNEIYGASSGTAGLTVTAPPAPVLTTGSTGSGGTVNAPSGPIQSGTVVTLTAVPNAGSTFTGWTVDGVNAGWANPLSLTMDANHAVQATFATAKQFPGDVPTSHPDYAAITELASRGYILGYNASSYGPGDGIQRAQMAVLIARATPNGPGTPTNGYVTPPDCTITGTWDCEDWGNTFTDRGGLDSKLWRAAGTLQHYNVARGYTAADCAAQGRAFPCYGPTDPVSHAQTIAFITRAMVAKGYWVLQPNAPLTDPNVPGVLAPEARTFAYYTGGLTPLPNGKGWNDIATRGWFAEALWAALNSYWGTDGNLPDGRPAGGTIP